MLDTTAINQAVLGHYQSMGFQVLETVNGVPGDPDLTVQRDGRVTQVVTLADSHLGLSDAWYNQDRIGKAVMASVENLLIRAIRLLTRQHHVDVALAIPESGDHVEGLLSLLAGVLGLDITAWLVRDDGSLVDLQDWLIQREERAQPIAV